MTMKMKNFMLLLALSGLAAGCSNDDLTEGGGEGTTPGARSEIQLSFSGTGESEEYNRARAIASESENQIDKLSVYLFASNAQNGTYYYLETWEEGTAYDASKNPYGFKKQASGTGWKASIYPHELKGLPYIKLLCVANNTASGATTDGKFYAEDGTAEVLATLTPVTVNAADGTVSNSGAATTEALFRATYSKKLAQDEANGIITTPLLMTGEGQTKISGSVSKVNIDLKRIMARFDIDNTTSRSNLTITQVTMVHGRPTGALFGAALTKVEKVDLDTKLMEYCPIDFTRHTGANQGLAESALYVYPTLATDESYLKVEGTYKSPITSQQVPVTYNIPIKRTAEGAAEGEYLPIKANSRYKLRISDVTQSNIFGTFEVQDWTSGGGINLKPDNDAPIFDDATAFSGANEPKPLTDADGAVYGYEVTGANGSGNFDITIAATGKVRAEKGEIVRATGDTDWLTVNSNPDYKEKDGVWYSKFNISYSDAIGKQPVAVTFINDAASYDPALWTTIHFYGPKAVPAFAALDGNAKGNVTKVDESTGVPTASIYAVNNSYVQFNVTCIEGVTVDPTALAAATGYKVEEVKTEGFVHTYKISVSDAARVQETATIKFQNTGDISKETVLTITKLDPAMKASQVSVDPVGAVTADFTASPNTLKVDMDILTSYSFKVEAPQNLVLANDALTNCPWLTITVEGDGWKDEDGKRYVQYKVVPKANPVNTDPYTLTFTNGLTDADKNILAPELELKITKDFSKPKLESGTTSAWSTFNQGLTSSFTDQYAASMEMYLVNGSAVTVKMSCDEAAAFETVAGLTIAETSAGSGEYKITVDDASKFDAKTPTVLTVYNTPAKTADASTTRKATLTINWKSAAITASLTANDNVAESGTPDAPVYTVDVANLSNFTFTVTAGGGATTDLSVLSGTFLKLHANNAGDGTLDAGVGEAYMLRIDDDTQTGDITMKFTNSIQNGGDLTITFKVKQP